MTKEELDKVLADHKAWLADSSKGARANLSCADLRYKDLSGVELHGANLSGATLLGTNLSGADLRWCNLRWADLTDANTSDADLSNAKLSGSVGYEKQGAKPMNYPDDIRSYDNYPRSPYYQAPPIDVDAEVIRIMDPDRPGFELLDMLDDCDAFQVTLKELLGQNAQTSLEALGVYARALILEADEYVRAEVEASDD